MWKGRKIKANWVLLLRLSLGHNTWLSQIPSWPSSSFNALVRHSFSTCLKRTHKSRLDRLELCAGQVAVSVSVSVKISSSYLRTSLTQPCFKCNRNAELDHQATTKADKSISQAYLRLKFCTNICVSVGIDSSCNIRQISLDLLKTTTTIVSTLLFVLCAYYLLFRVSSSF